MSDDKKLVQEAVLRDFENLKKVARKEPNSWFWNQPFVPPDDGDDGQGRLICLTLALRTDLNNRAVKIAAHNFRAIQERYPRAQIYVSLMGYDDDPRQIWQIPEAVQFFRLWASELSIRTVEKAESQRLDKMSLMTLAACGVFGDEIRQTILTQSRPASTH